MRRLAINISVAALSSIAMPTEAFADSFSWPLADTISVTTQKLVIEHSYFANYGDFDIVDSVGMKIRDWDPFEESNSISSIKCFDRENNSIIWDSPCPPLSYIWVDTSTGYVVGLSTDKLHGPYQFIVFDEAGAVVMKKTLRGRGLCFSQTYFAKMMRRNPDMFRTLANHISFSDSTVFLAYYDRLLNNYFELDSLEFFGDFFCFNPHLPGIRESVSLSVEWYDEERPGLQILYDDGKFVSITINNTLGQPITFKPMTKLPWK